MGYRTILVLTGTTQEADLARSAYGPDRVIRSVAELADPATDLLDVIPAGDVDDDSVPDMDAWRQAAS